MNWLILQANRVHDWVEGLGKLDFLGLLLLRLFLAPIFISAGLNKLASFSSTVEWFANPDWGLGLPFPEVMATLAMLSELVGGFLLLFGLATRYIAVPLMVTMLVAIFAVHSDNGWFAIAPSDPGTSMAQPLAEIGFPGAQDSLENSRAVSERLDAAKSLLREHGNYDWLTEKGNFVVLNNGVEFAVTYFIMLLVLFFQGAGRFLSLDHWLRKRFRMWRD
jgi:putative oxidoreductase